MFRIQGNSGALVLAAAMAVLMPALASGDEPAPATPGQFANETDLAYGKLFDDREKDWRNGAIVYQVLVDRFAPPANLEQKRALYPAPKVLRRWDEVPTRGTYLADAKVWSHEIDFWGGDLQSVRGRLDYIKQMGADVVYLNPIHLAWTNHKYDALDYKDISPEFGTREDLDALIGDVHRQGMKIVLDGVFNHVGRNSKMFQEAAADPGSPYRSWFYFGPQYPGGARIWRDAANLLELNLENPTVRDYVYASPDSVVQSYLAEGTDGWRLDVAYDIGFSFLGGLTRAAHQRKPGSLVIGELSNYPREWFPSVDGVINFTMRQILIKTVQGEIAADVSARMIDRIITEAGIEPMLKSWMMLDNHDTQRIGTELPVESQRRLAQVLQFTLPGSPNVYYGTELGMTGAGDPEMRAPMRWDLVNERNPTLAWMKKLIAVRKQHRALRIGNFRLLGAGKLFAFERYTDRIQDAVVVIANPSKEAITEIVMVPDSKLMSDVVTLANLLDPSAKPVPINSAMLTVTVPADSVLVLAPDMRLKDGYTPYKRIQ
jgi:glycosidase